MRKVVLDLLSKEYFWYGMACGSLIHAVLDTVAKMRKGR